MSGLRRSARPAALEGCQALANALRAMQPLQLVHFRRLERPRRNAGDPRDRLERAKSLVLRAERCPAEGLRGSVRDDGVLQLAQPSIGLAAGSQDGLNRSLRFVDALAHVGKSDIESGGLGFQIHLALDPRPRKVVPTSVEGGFDLGSEPFDLTEDLDAAALDPVPLGR